MKITVNLMVLYATLLLLTGVAFADGVTSCECYKINYIGLDVVYTGTQYYPICLNYEEHSGTSDGCDLSLFDGLSKQVVATCPGCVAFFKFHGEDNNVLTGMEYCETGGRLLLWGHKTDPSNCPS
jgi:hypothetical protein